MDEPFIVRTCSNRACCADDLPGDFKQKMLVKGALVVKQILMAGAACHLFHYIAQAVGDFMHKLWHSCW
jgi:hypothetical protein